MIRDRGGPLICGLDWRFEFRLPVAVETNRMHVPILLMEEILHEFTRLHVCHPAPPT